MSSILKALKKLEHEKVVQKPETFRIDADILRGGTTRRPLAARALLGGIVIFACGVGATYFFMKHDTAPAPDQRSQGPKNRPDAELSSGPTVVVPVSTSPAAEPALPAPEQQTLPFAKTTPVLVRPEHPAHFVDKRQQSPRTLSAEVPPQTIPAEPRSATIPPPAAPHPSVLKVDGIAFQDGGTDGVAVVNGVAVSKGAMIEGARVEEIQKDRVKFSRGGEKFEIILDKTN